MSNVHFHEITISDSDHRIISADVEAYGIFNSDKLTAMEEYVAPEYRESFVKNISLCEDKWFPARIKTDKDYELFYVRAARTDDAYMLRVVLVNIDELLEAHYRLNRQIGAYKAQLDLFDDVFFEYNPQRGTVNVFNTEIAQFDSGVYSLDEFEELLTRKVTGKQKSKVKAFISQIKSKTGRMSLRIDKNILNDDPNINHSVLEESFVYYDRETEGVVGHIHLGTAKGRSSATSIKHDSLTGLVDKTDIMRMAKERIDDRRLEGTTIAIIDIDYFKNINDTFGHQFGDEVIKRVAEIVTKEVGNDGVAGRFGGDEFIVVFYNVQSEDELRAKLKSIKNMVSATFPDKGVDDKTPLSVSIGSATFPCDADNYDDIFMLADHCLYLAKEKGRNRYVFYTPSRHGTIDEIKEKRSSIKKISERDLSYGDVLVKMFDMTLHGNGSTLEHFMDEFADIFEFQHMALYVGMPYKLRYVAGSNIFNNEDVLNTMLAVLNSDSIEKYLNNQTFVVVNRLETLPPYARALKDFLSDVGVYSYILIRFNDKDGRGCILTIASVGKKTTWNQTHFKLYRAFTDLLGLYSIE